MRAIYARGLAGFPIRLAQGFGQWSHGGVVMPDWSVVNARPGHGVISEPWGDFTKRYSHYAVVEIYTPSDAQAYECAQRLVAEGWGYGYGEVANFLTHKLGVWDKPDRAQCIEVIEICAAHGGRVGDLRRFRDHVGAHEVTPQQSYITR